jgi:hypothetical protein
MLCEDGGHPLAVFQIDAGRRHKVFHRCVRAHLALPHLLLDDFR